MRSETSLERLEIQRMTSDLGKHIEHCTGAAISSYPLGNSKPG